MKFVAELCEKYGLEINKNTVFTHYEFGQNNPNTTSYGKIDITYIPSYPWVNQKEAGDFIRSKSSLVQREIYKRLIYGC